MRRVCAELYSMFWQVEMWLMIPPATDMQRKDEDDVITGNCKANFFVTTSLYLSKLKY